MIRPATVDDFIAIVALNLAFERFLSPLDASRLARLDHACAYHKVIELDKRMAAFLLAFRERADYDSINYQWFDQRYERFLYIDRIVVAEGYRGMGLARTLYDDIFEYARQSLVTQVALEYDIDPPNEPSRRLHQSLGFVEVGRQDAVGKQVSLQMVTLVPSPVS